jgi:DeoR family transcriptional regulator of aga operon
VVLADASKLGAVKLAKVCDVDEVDLLVTDCAADQETVAELIAAGCPVDLADPDRPALSR